MAEVMEEWSDQEGDVSSFVEGFDRLDPDEYLRTAGRTD